MTATDVGLFRVGWRLRETPLEPTAVAATGDAAAVLARRLLRLSDPELRQLKGAAGPGLLLAIGVAESLPWSAGVVYLGLVEGRNALLLPTTHEPDVPLELFEAAVKRQFPAAQYPLAILPQAGVAASAYEARPLCRETLTRWLSEAAP